MTTFASCATEAVQDVLSGSKTSFRATGVPAASSISSLTVAFTRKWEASADVPAYVTRNWVESIRFRGHDYNV